MKPLDEIVACVLDYGTFISLADKLSESYGKVYYHSPIESEYRNCQNYVKGDGIKNVHRLNDYMEPRRFKEIDLWIFPDIGYGGLQKFLREAGKLVWGSMGADEMELNRVKFINAVRELGLPVIPSEAIKGLTNLSDHLRQVKNKWVKVNHFRDNMETWHHIDWVHSQRKLEEMAIQFGGIKDRVMFLVQDDLPTEVEIGYDGWTIDGEFPASSYQGYEKKNELYLGALTDYQDLPEQVREVNEAIAPMLKEYQYRNFIATEIRVADAKPHYTDPTNRLPGQTGEQLLETCSNLAEVIARGADGELVVPVFEHKFAVEATLHYTGQTEEWKTIEVPSYCQKWFKGYHYCIVDGAYQFPPFRCDEVGVMLGVGDTIEEAINHLKSNLGGMKDEPVKADLGGFADLIKSINEAEEAGVEFTAQEIPEPSVALE